MDKLQEVSRAREIFSISWKDSGHDYSIRMDIGNGFTFETGSMRVKIPADKFKELVRFLAFYPDW